MLDTSRIAFIGGGVMCEAILSRLLKGSSLSADAISVAEPIAARREQLAGKYAVHVTSDNAAAAEQATIVVLSVKPQIMSLAMESIKAGLAQTALVISIAAGVAIRSIQNVLGSQQPVVRVMPNTPAQIGEGLSVWTTTAQVSVAQKEQARSILQAMGREVYVENEHYLDMATALSGSGPAYVFLFMEALIDAGVQLGFSRPVAQQLVEQTLKGSVDFAIASGRHVAELRNQVTSPGGTTAAGLYELESGRLRTTIADAVRAAYRRSIELGKSE